MFFSIAKLEAPIINRFYKLKRKITKPQLLLIFSLRNHTYLFCLFSNLFMQPSPISKINESTRFTEVNCQIGLVFN